MPHLPSRQTAVSALVAGAVAATVSVGPAVAEQTARIAQSVTGKTIKNSSVTGDDILNGSLKGADIGTGTLTGADIAGESVGGDDIRADSIGSSDIVNNLTGVDIEDSSLGGADIGQDALTGREVSESTLSGVRSVQGRVPFNLKLAGGQAQVVATSGPLSLVAECIENDAGTDRVQLLAATTEPDSMLSAEDDLEGGLAPSDYLQPTTDPGDRRIVDETRGTATTYPEINTEIDEGVVVDSDGQHAIAVNSEGITLGFDIGGAACYISGIVDVVA